MKSMKLQNMNRTPKQTVRQVKRSFSRGFTISELLVASVASCLVLFGAYRTLLQGRFVEERNTGKWVAQNAATAVVRQIVNSLENIVNLPEHASLVGKSVEEGNGYILQCTNHGQLLQYHWYGPQDEQNQGILERKQILYAGSSAICPAQPDLDGQGDQLWEHIEPEIIAKNVDALTIRFRPADDPDATWENSWSSSVGNVLVAVQVTVDGQTVKNLIVPKANVTAMETGG